MAIDRTPGPTDANTLLFDASLRHQIGVRNFASGEVKRLLKLLAQADKELTEKLRVALGNMSSDVKSKRLKKLLDQVKEARQSIMRELRGELKSSMTELGKLEADFEIRMLNESLPVAVTFETVGAATIVAAVTTQPFSGGIASARTLNQWFEGLAEVDQRRLTEAIQLGLIQGETVDQMIQRVAGTRANNFQDGVLSIARRNAEAVVRTGINHISNAARELVWAQNAELFDALRWTSTLDGRTSAICRKRDGKFTTIGGKSLPPKTPKLVPQDARPPAHPSCRSIMVAVFSIDGVLTIIGTRPFVRDKRTRKFREMDFRAEAKAKAGDRWTDMTRAERNKAVAGVRNKWADENIGSIPADVTYQQWLKRQPAAFQDEVLGKTKGKLFRGGNLTVDKFVDRSGAELTLSQLAKQDPTAFISAGLDPKDFT